MYYTITPSPFGNIALTANQHGLTALAFQAGEQPLTIPNHLIENNEFFQPAILQLQQYFSGDRQQFNLPLAPYGTPFRQSVWQALTTIPWGETRSYGWLANEIQNPKAVRAVGSANGANPIALIVPCHRVIGSNGKLTGYAGGLLLKQKLLAHEGINCKL